MSFWGDDKIFIVAEIGSNHNGDLELCKRMIIKAKECGADAVKIQKRYNDKTFMKSILGAPYQSEYARETGTYREHREYLDRFDKKEFQELKKLANDIGIIFFATPFDYESVDFLHSLDMPIYKIASCDLKNLPLIKYIATIGKPVMLSTGGGREEDIFKAICQFMPNQHKKFLAVLHCISTYPNQDNQLNLNFIKRLKQSYSIDNWGFSSHHPGILPLFIAYMCGARIFEMHFTFNRSYPGTDHAFSLEPAALRKACFDLRRIPIMLGNGIKKVLPEEEKGFVWKFGKAIHPIRSIRKGELFTFDNIAIKAPADGLSPNKINDILGKIAICDISTNDILTEDKIDKDSC